jgi:hypothetical protein
MEGGSAVFAVGAAPSGFESSWDSRWFDDVAQD